MKARTAAEQMPLPFQPVEESAFPDAIRPKDSHKEAGWACAPLERA
jgi:hypothetical protein